MSTKFNVGIITRAIFAVACIYITLIAYTSEVGSVWYSSVAGGGGSSSYENRERGLPIPYMATYASTDLATGAQEAGVDEFDVVACSVDLLVAGLLAVCAHLGVRALSRVFARGRVGLKGLLLFVTVVTLAAAYIGGVFRGRSVEEKAIADLTVLGVEVTEAYSGPLLVRRLIDAEHLECYDRATVLFIYHEKVDEVSLIPAIAEATEKLLHVRILDLSFHPRPDAFLRALGSLRNSVQIVDLSDSRVGDEALRELQHWGDLEEVDLRGTSLSSETLEWFKQTRPSVVVEMD